MKIKYKHEIKKNESITEKEIVQILLKNRGIKNEKDFFNPPSPITINLSDFGFKKEIKKTLALLEKIKKENRMIVVYTDYDADGITGGAILWETLNNLGFKTMPYVPHRKLEGYGFSLKGIDAVKKQFNPALIISVDHGITAREKVTYAKKLGISIIITDHHLKPDKLPTDAYAIFHIPVLSGSGVSYFFSKMIYDHFHSEPVHPKGVLSDNFEIDYLALSSIGTIADLVPLIGPSRSLVYYGLQGFSKTKRVGIRHILREAGIENKKISPYDIGFIIAPRINAVGRLEHAIDALRLLCTKREDKAYDLASRVAKKNRQRQDLVLKAVEEARLRVEATVDKQKKLPKLIILEDENWHEGIIGLIASRITEEYYRPTIVLTENDGFLKGSARSIPSFHITDFLRGLKADLIDVGGHKGAAGFTLEKNKLKDFIKKAQKKADSLLAEKDLKKTIEADLKIPLTKINLRLALELEKLQPFGIGNPNPVFYSEAEIVGAKLFGKTNNHLKILVKDANISADPLELISFNNAKLFTELSRGLKTEIVYSLEIDRWGGNEKLRSKLIYMDDSKS